MARRKSTRLAWGKIRSLKSGRFQASVPLGHQKYQPAPYTFKTRTAAEDWLRDQESKVRRRELVLSERMDDKFSVWAEEWLDRQQEKLRQKNITPRTYMDNRTHLNLYVRPLLDEIPIRSIDERVVRKFLAWVDETAPGPSPKRKARGFASSVMYRAVQHGVVSKNPFKNDDIVTPRLPRARRTKCDWTKLTVERIVNAVPLEYRAAILVAAYSGCRASEVWGLQIESPNFATNTLHVTWGLTEVSDDLIADDERARTGVRKGLPKPQRLKDLPMTKRLSRELADHLERRDGKSGDWLFVDHYGLPIRHSSFYKNIFMPLRDEIGLPSTAHFHSLRHFCGSYFLSLGYTQFQVMKLLDHTETEMTKLYSHLLTDDKDFHRLADLEDSDSSGVGVELLEGHG